MSTNYKILAAPFVLMLLFFIQSCKKNELHTSSTTEAGGAQVKVVFASFYKANPLYQIKINGERVSPVFSSSSHVTPFPGGGLNTGGGSTADYLSVNAGSNIFSFATPKVGTNTDSVVIATSTVTLEQGKKYSLYLADTSANTQTIVVVDSLTKPDSGYAKYKFVNLMPDVAALDLYIGTVKVASNVPYKGVSPSFVVPTNSPSFSWAIRTVGGATNLVAYAGTAATVGNQRIYTVFARGYNSITSTATTEVRRRAVSLVFNE